MPLSLMRAIECLFENLPFQRLIAEHPIASWKPNSGYAYSSSTVQQR